MTYFIDEETCFGEKYIVNILGFVGKKFFVASSQPYYCGVKAAIDNT